MPPNEKVISSRRTVELKSHRQPSPKNIRNYESLEENHTATARKLQLSREEVAGTLLSDCRTTLIVPGARYQLYEPSSPNGMSSTIFNTSTGLEPIPIGPRKGPRNPNFDPAPELANRKRRLRATSNPTEGHHSRIFGPSRTRAVGLTTATMPDPLGGRRHRRSDTGPTAPRSRPPAEPGPKRPKRSILQHGPKWRTIDHGGETSPSRSWLRRRFQIKHSRGCSTWVPMESRLSGSPRRRW
jgi:hypothetical protein